MTEAAGHPCPYRTSNETLAHCRLIADLVGSEKPCGVHESLCKACMERGAPDLTAPNPYLASVGHKATHAAAKVAAQKNDKNAFLHWAPLAAFFQSRLLRQPTPPKAEAAERPKPCEYLGKIVERKSCNCPRKHVYECGRFRDQVAALPLLVSPINQCEGCNGYEPDVDAEPFDQVVSNSKG